MSQELLPSSTQTARQRALVPVASVATADAPPRQPGLARAIKWPLRKLFKGLYYAIVAIRGHRAAAAVLALIVVGLLGSGLVIYRVTHPASDIPTSLVGGSGPYSGSTPFTIVDAAAPPLPAGIITWMHGHQTFNASEVWGTLSATAQQAYAQKGVTESSLQSNFDRLRSQGIHITEFIYTGGYQIPSGTSHYTIEMVVAEGNQASIQTYYFVVGADGKIAGAINLSAAG